MAEKHRVRRTLFITSIALFIATSCSFDKAVSESPAGTAASESITLSVLAYTESPGTGVYPELLDEFRIRHPSVELEVTALSGERYRQRLDTLAATGKLPELMYLWPGPGSGSVTAGGLAEDLKPYLEGKVAQFVAGALAAQGPDGEIWELPENIRVSGTTAAKLQNTAGAGAGYAGLISELLEEKTDGVAPGPGYGMKAGLQGTIADIAWDWIWLYSGPIGTALRLGDGSFPAYNFQSLDGDIDTLIVRQLALCSGCSGRE